VTSSSRSSQCDLIISGRIVNTKDLEPIAEAVISGEQFSAVTDENGEFSAAVTLTEDGIVDDITVEKEGFLIKEFRAFLGSVAQLNTCPAVTNISWDIALSESLEGVWVGPTEGAWFKIMDTLATEIIDEEGMLDTLLITNVFTIDIRRGSFDEPRRVTISPDHSRASGPGLPIELQNFVLISFNVDIFDGSNGLQAIASSRNEPVFLKPLDIRFPLPIAIDPDDFSTIGFEDLAIDAEPIALDGNGNIVYFQTDDGTHCIAFDPLLTEVVQPALQALQSGASLEEINQIITDGLTTVGETGNGLGGGVTEIIVDDEANGRIANKATLSNCDCGNPTSQNFAATLEGFENLDINFLPSTTATERAEAVAIVRDLLGLSGAEIQSVSLDVDLDKCSTATVCSQEIVRTVTGTVNGFSFTFEGTDRLETTVVEGGNCPTTTPCHQGCPG